MVIVLEFLQLVENALLMKDTINDAKKNILSTEDQTKKDKKTEIQKNLILDKPDKKLN